MTKESEIYKYTPKTSTKITGRTDNDKNGDKDNDKVNKNVKENDKDNEIQKKSSSQFNSRLVHIVIIMCWWNSWNSFLASCELSWKDARR